MSELIVFEKPGDTRRRTVRLEPGRRIDLNDLGTMVVQVPVLIDICEVYETGRDEYGPTPLKWREKSYYVGSVRRAPPTRWQRLLAWLKRKPLPKAVVVSTKETV